jgi:elongation factor G
LLKALRHEAPGPQATANRLSVNGPALHVFKINHGGSVGRLALARALGGSLSEGSDVKAEGGVARLGARVGRC